MATVIYWVNDLLFTSKIREVAGQLGVEVQAVRDVGSLVEKAAGAKLVILDLRLPSAIDALAQLSANPDTKEVQKVGFIDHERVEIMEAARESGCRALAKGKFTSELPSILSGLS